jgi:hypothetical protein
VYAYYDGIIGALVDDGFCYHLAHRALHELGSPPLGFVQEVFALAAAGESEEEPDMSAMAGELPQMAAMVAAEVHDVTDPVLGWCDSQTEFEFILDLLSSTDSNASTARRDARRDQRPEVHAHSRWVAGFVRIEAGAARRGEAFCVPRRRVADGP